MHKFPVFISKVISLGVYEDFYFVWDEDVGSQTAPPNLVTAAYLKWPMLFPDSFSLLLLLIIIAGAIY